MLNFACIRDCSVCPFSCNRNITQKKPTRNNTTQLPQGLKDFPKFQQFKQKNANFDEILDKDDEIKSEFAENTKKPLEFPQENVNFEQNQSNFENLPVLSDVQYEVKNVKKRSLLDILRRKK